MTVGKAKTHTMPAPHVSGPHQPARVMESARHHLPPDMHPEVGQHLHGQQQNGETLEAVTAMSEGHSTRGRCSKGVDPVLEGYPKLIAIDEEANHQIVHRRRFGKAYSAPDEPLDPGPQVEVFALDFLRVFLAHVMLRWIDVPLVSAPPIRVKAGNTKRFQQGL
jgi:hypothetical protein